MFNGKMWSFVSKKQVFFGCGLKHPLVLTAPLLQAETLPGLAPGAGEAAGMAQGGRFLT